LLIQKYTPTDRFFGDFAHWDRIYKIKVADKMIPLFITINTIL